MLNQAEKYVLSEINSIGGLKEFEDSIERIKLYLHKAYEGEYYNSKNIRLSEWNPDKGELFELILAIFTIVLSNQQITYQAIVSALISRLRVWEDDIKAVKTLAEVIAIVSQSGLINIKRNGKGNYIMISTDYVLDNIPEPDRHEIIFKEPSKPKSNYDEEFGSRILGSKYNYHEDNICLDHIHRMNKIQFKLYKPLIKKYEEEPTYDLDTKEKIEQWDAFVRSSYNKYLQISKKGNKFYFNHNYDKRGRCYAEGYYVNTQGTSFKKAIIQLANEELVNQRINYEE